MDRGRSASGRDRAFSAILLSNLTMELCVFDLLFFAAMIAAASAPSNARVAPSPPVREAATKYHFENGIMASRANDQRLYVLLGSDIFRATSSGDPRVFVSDWLRLHPKAVVTPISRLLSTNTRTHHLMEIVYVWVEDGSVSLNVDLIRYGVFIGGTMYDMVDNEKGLDRLLQSDPKLADAHAEIEKERAAVPQDGSERLIPDDDYKERIARIGDAEKAARAKKQGIWSDAMKEEREADGIR